MLNKEAPALFGARASASRANAEGQQAQHVLCVLHVGPWPGLHTTGAFGLGPGGCSSGLPQRKGEGGHCRQPATCPAPAPRGRMDSRLPEHLPACEVHESTPSGGAGRRMRWDPGSRPTRGLAGSVHAPLPMLWPWPHLGSGSLPGHWPCFVVKSISLRTLRVPACSLARGMTRLFINCPKHRRALP